MLEEYGGDASNLGQTATSSFLLWATAAKACGFDLTRECMVEQLAQVHEWDGGGLHAPTDPGHHADQEILLVSVHTCGALGAIRTPAHGSGGRCSIP